MTAFRVSCKLRPLCHAYYVHDLIGSSASPQEHEHDVAQ